MKASDSTEFAKDIYEILQAASGVSGKSGKKVSRTALRYAAHCMSLADLDGLSVVLFDRGIPISNNPVVAARVGLAQCGDAESLKSSFSNCSCEDCARVAPYPAKAILGGYRDWIDGVAKGRHGVDMDLLVTLIVKRIEPL